MPRFVIPEYAVLRLAPMLSPRARQPGTLTHLDLAAHADTTATASSARPADGPDGSDPDELIAPFLVAPAAIASDSGPVVFSLRWALNPLIGFPRAPFQVWRRARDEDPTQPVLGGAPRTAPGTATLPNQAIEVRFHADPQGGTLRVEALGSNGNVLPGQRLTFTSVADGRFRSPGISALRLTGRGQITSIGVLEQNAYANLPGWELIDVVGFPFAKSEISPPDYDPVPQGPAAPSLDGIDAALFRLKAGQLLQQPPLAPGGGLPQPSWPFPDPGRFLDVLRKGPLIDIDHCLRNSRDDDPTRLQILQLSGGSFDGIHQPGLSQPDPNNPASLTLPTTRYVAMAMQDNPVALGLGFGTFDAAAVRLWPVKEQLPPDVAIVSQDYMITADVTLALGYKFELAALGFLQAPPEMLQQVQATQTFANRPVARDQAGSAAVLLDWAPAREPIGAGILLHRAGTDTIVNVPRPQASGGFQPYLMPHTIGPDGEPDATQSAGVTMPEEPAPTSGTSVTTYAAAPIDVHGRWGPWALTTHSLAAEPVQRPGLADVRINLPATLPASGPVVPNASLVVEVTWDWADRSLDRIEVTGVFVPLGPPPTSVSGFQTSSTGAVGSFAVTIEFSASAVPSIRVPASPAAAVAVAQASNVVEVADPNSPPGTGAPPAGSAGSQVRRYRLTVPVMQLSFATATQLAYAVSARAAERVRPAELSGPVDPRATTVANPFPADPPAIPQVEVLWTAQPDASGRARTVLSWPSVPGASGYIVWEATEAALFQAVSNAAPPAGQTIRARANDLKAKIMSNQAKSLATFTRLNERPIQATSMELTLPGSADTLYVYRLSSITAQNVESGRSTDVVLVSVPKIERPGTPALEGRYDAETGEIVLTVVPGSGLAPHEIATHRVRKSLLAQVIDTMGPAVQTAVVSTLAPVPVPSLSGPPRSGYEFVDPVQPSWVPYFYRAVAIGRDLPSDGIRAGSSPASGVATVLAPPPMPPVVSDVTVTRSGTAALVSFSTDLPVRPTPAGSGQLVVSTLDASGTLSAAASFETSAVRQAAALTLPASPLTQPDATRRAPSNGVFEVTVLIPPTASSIVVTATDPLGRSTAIEGA